MSDDIAKALAAFGVPPMPYRDFTAPSRPAEPLAAASASAEPPADSAAALFPLLGAAVAEAAEVRLASSLAPDAPAAVEPVSAAPMHAEPAKPLPSPVAEPRPLATAVLPVAAAASSPPGPVERAAPPHPFWETSLGSQSWPRHAAASPPGLWGRQREAPLLERPLPAVFRLLAGRADGVSAALAPRGELFRRI